MSDLSKLADDLSSLTEVEIDELAALLDGKRGSGVARAVERLHSARLGDDAASDVGLSIHDLTSVDWLTAEAVSLKTEAVELARSLSETSHYVRLRCDAVRRVG